MNPFDAFHRNGHPPHRNGSANNGKILRGRAGPAGNEAECEPGHGSGPDILRPSPQPDQTTLPAQGLLEQQILRLIGQRSRKPLPDEYDLRIAIVAMLLRDQKDPRNVARLVMGTWKVGYRAACRYVRLAQQRHPDESDSAAYFVALRHWLIDHGSIWTGARRGSGPESHRLLLEGLGRILLRELKVWTNSTQPPPTTDLGQAIMEFGGGEVDLPMPQDAFHSLRRLLLGLVRLLLREAMRLGVQKASSSETGKPPPF